MKNSALALTAAWLCALSASCQQLDALDLSLSPPPAPAISALSVDGGFVRRRGTSLFDGEHLYRALGTNRFDLVAGQLATACQRDRTPESLRSRQIGTLVQLRQAGGSVARLWAFQSMAGPDGDDFSHLDSLIDVAHQIGVGLILVLENHYAECTAVDTPARDLGWYQKGFTQPYGGYKMSFEAYVEKIVRRYAHEPAILMWQIINEAQAPGHPEAVQQFLSRISHIIRQHDHTHLICGGGALDCARPEGAAEYDVMAQVPELDVLDVHDFGEERVPWPGCLATAKRIADRRQMSLMIGESGISADAELPERRAYLMRQKISAAAAQGVGIYLMWSLNTSPQYPDRFDILKGDPAMDALRHQATETFSMADGLSDDIDLTCHETSCSLSEDEWWAESMASGSWDDWEPVIIDSQQAQSILEAEAEAEAAPQPQRLSRPLSR